MAEKRDPLAWSTPVNQAATRKRNVFWVNGKLLLCPIIVPGVVGILSTSGQAQFYWIALAAFFAVVAAALEAWNPWFLDDYEVELAYPRCMTDVAPDHEPTAFDRAWSHAVALVRERLQK